MTPLLPSSGDCWETTEHVWCTCDGGRKLHTTDGGVVTGNYQTLVMLLWPEAAIGNIRGFCERQLAGFLASKNN